MAIIEVMGLKIVMDAIQGVNPTVGFILAPFLLGFISVVLILWYSSQKQSYWKKKGIPYVKPIPFFGSTLELLTKPFHETLLDQYRKYGRIYGYYEGNKPLLAVAEPELLRNILVKDFNSFTSRRGSPSTDKISKSMLVNLKGDDWKRVRTIITPTFTTGKIKRMMSIFKECSQTLIKNFKDAAERGEPIDVKRLYGAFTMDIIASSAFSTKLDSHNDPNNKFVATARSLLTRKLNWRIIGQIFFPKFMRLFRIKAFSAGGTKFFADVTLEIIEERKRTGQTRNDFLQLLIDTAKEVDQENKLDLTERDDITENYGKIDSNQALKNQYLQKSLSRDELVAQCIIFFLAGYDTTASTLSFASYLLALNPDIQEKLIQELDDVLRTNDGELTYEAVQNMKYLDNVISETLRIYPPAARIERVADQDYKLGDTGITVPKGMIVSVPLYAMHRDPKLFPDPEKFDPDRFSSEERAKRDMYSYIPFGAGPRNCIGMRFALMEAKICLAHVLSNFRIKKCSQTKVPLEFYVGQILLQPTDITLLMEIRKDAVKSL